jgi:hypothetical protein
LIEMVEWAGTHEPAAPALLAPGRKPLQYERLVGLRNRGRTPRPRPRAGQPCRARGRERSRGRHRLPLGRPAAAVAPLNPAYREAELAFSLDDIGAEALVIGATIDSPAQAVAAERGIEVIELHVDPTDPAGVFNLASVAQSAIAVEPDPDDVALLLHTSGTTSRPKLVPITHHRLSVSARNVAETLQLEAADRCLNVMPLFHIHGLVAALLGSLATCLATSAWAARSSSRWRCSWRSPTRRPRR